MNHRALIFLTLILLVVISSTSTQGQYIYGTTQGGGANGTGTIFRFKPDGTAFTTEYNFAPAVNPGASPWYTSLMEINNKLYGTTSAGGLFGAGVLFEFDPASGNYRVVKDFEFLASGKFPSGNLVSKNGKIYGATAYGGANGSGTIFAYDFANDALTILYSFPAALTFPAGLSDGGNGKIYALLSGDGTYHYGSILEIDPTNSAVTQKASFDASTTGVVQQATALTLAANGKFYGTTETGGPGSDVGILFELNPATGTLVGKIEFEGSGLGRPPGMLLSASNGLLYGTSYGLGGMRIFKYNPVTNSINGEALVTSQYIDPIVGAQTVDGKIYMITQDGHPNSIFEFDPIMTTVAKKIDIDESIFGTNPKRAPILASNGKLYGTTSSGGAGGVGTIFEYDPSANTLTKKIDLNVVTNGGFPINNLSLGANGKLYGTTKGGNTGDGVIYEFDPVSKIYNVKIQFDDRANKGVAPVSAMTPLSNGKLLGISPTNEASLEDGIIFEFDPIAGTFAKKTTFTQTFANNTVNKFVAAGNGKLYTTARSGTSGSQGAVFEYDPVSSVFSQKYAIASSNGAPMGTLALTPSGTFLGKAPYSNIFEFNPASGSYVTKLFNIGLNPIGGLLKASNGKYYGTDESVLVTNGTSASILYGAVYEYDYGTNTVTNKVDLDVNLGYNSRGAFIEGNAGKLYAVMPQGGAFGYGTLVEYDIATGTLSVKQNFSGSNGVRPSGEFMIVAYDDKPYISGFSPMSGPSGNQITITGVNFSANPADNIVKFNGVAATVVSSTTTAMTVVVPAGATTGPISVTINSNFDTSANDFTFTPTITSFAPNFGLIGASVTISGTNFSATPANNVVRFNNIPAVVTASNATSITTSVPAGATTGPVTVAVNSVTASGGNTFIVLSSSPAITSFTPLSGTAGTTVTLTGVNFSATPANNSVKFNGVAATVIASTSTSITTKVPAGATTGVITVTVNGVTGVSVNTFVVLFAPTITSFTPQSGPVGTSVTITGANFSVTPSNNTVKFNNVTATVTASTASSITATVPSAATSGAISVTVSGTTPLTATSTGSFSVTTAAVTTGDLHSDPDADAPVVYPNPAKDEITIELHVFDKTKDVELMVFDQSGRQIEKRTGTGGSKVVMDVRRYSHGNYIIRAVQQKKSYSIQFVKD